MKNNSFYKEQPFMRLCKRYSHILNKWPILILLVIFAAGCKKVTEEAGLIGICPEVVSTDPVDTASRVAFSKTINATFNEEMKASTITPATFTLKQGTTAITGSVTYTGITATFTPSVNLTPNTTYTATVMKAVKDTAGNSPISDYVWSFTTGAAPDIISPTVTSTDPLNAATDVVFCRLPIFSTLQK